MRNTHILLLALALPSRAFAGDCNQNGVDDAIESAGGQIADCNRNGIPDECDVLPLFPTLEEHSQIDLPDRDGETVASADLDGDGIDDAIAVGREIRVYRGLGGGAFGKRVTYTGGGSATKARVGKIDNDTTLDLALLGFDPEITILPGDGGGGFGAARTLSLSAQATAMDFSDLDADGDADFVVATEAQVTLLRVSETGFESETVAIFTTFIGDVVLADFFGQDGEPDLAVSTPNEIRFFTNTGLGSFRFRTAERGISDKATLEAADLDADGDIDLIVAWQDAQRVSIVVNNGADGMDLAQTIEIGQFPSHPRVADFDGDGGLDIVVASRHEHFRGVRILPNLGEGRFGAPRRLLLDKRLETLNALAVAPIDSGPDGDPGLLLFDRNRGLFSLENRRRPRSEDCDGNGIPDDCEDLRGCRDCNDNGVPDTDDIANDAASDDNQNGVPDLCESEKPSFALDFDAPNFVTGPIDSTVSFPVAARVHSMGLAPGEPGLISWSVLVVCEGGEVADMTFDGTPCEGADGRTAFSLLGSFSSFDPCDPDVGFVCVPSLIEQVFLDVIESPHDLLNFTVETTIPEGDPEIITLRVWDGFCGGGLDQLPEDDGGGAAGGPQTVLSTLDGTQDAEIRVKRVRVFSNGGRIFHRGDANDDGALDISDPIRVLDRLFLGVADIPCRDAADANDDGRLDVSDAIRLIDYLFRGAGAPPSPGPPGSPCGTDLPDPAGDQGCAMYSSCG